MTLAELVDQAQACEYHFQPHELKEYRAIYARYDLLGELSPDDAERLVELVERYAA